MSNEERRGQLNELKGLTESSQIKLKQVYTMINNFLINSGSSSGINCGDASQTKPEPIYSKPDNRPRTPPKLTKRALKAVAEPVIEVFPQAPKTTKPKKLLTPYFLFLQRNRVQVRDAYPHLVPKEIANVMGSIWKSMKPEEKEIYNAEYLKNKAVRDSQKK